MSGKNVKLLLKILNYNKKELINWTRLKIKPKEKFLIYLIKNNMNNKLVWEG